MSSKRATYDEIRVFMVELRDRVDTISKDVGYLSRKIDWLPLEIRNGMRPHEMKPWERALLDEMRSEIDEVEPRLSLSLVLSCVAFSLALFAACS